jgi:hypothetical protein
VVNLLSQDLGLRTQPVRLSDWPGAAGPGPREFTEALGLAVWSLAAFLLQRTMAGAICAYDAGLSGPLLACITPFGLFSTSRV